MSLVSPQGSNHLPCLSIVEVGTTVSTSRTEQLSVGRVADDVHELSVVLSKDGVVGESENYKHLRKERVKREKKRERKGEGRGGEGETGRERKEKEGVREREGEEREKERRGERWEVEERMKERSK